MNYTLNRLLRPIGGLVFEITLFLCDITTQELSSRSLLILTIKVKREGAEGPLPLEI